MRRLLTLLIIITAFSNHGNAQSRADSILSIWNDETIHDTIRLNTLDPELRTVMEAGRSIRLYPVFDSFIELARKYNKPMKEANGLMARGQLMTFIEGGDHSPRPYFEKALEIYKTLEFNFGIARALSNVGNTYRYTEPVKAINQMKEALNVSIEANELLSAIECSYNLSRRYLELGERGKALEVVTQAVNWAEELGNKQYMAMAYHGLSHVYITQGELDKDNDFHDKVYELYIELANDNGALSMLGHISESYQSQNDYSSALKYYFQSLEMAEKTNAPIGMASAHVNLAKCFLKKEFTQVSEKLSAKELVAEINTCFETFDAICEQYGVEKIKTIGDAYMAAGGLPIPKDDSVKNTVLAALDMQAFISKRKTEKESAVQPAFEMRCGIHTGPVVAGIVGVKKFQYDIWGDTVNTASRMESHGEVGKVNISEATYSILKIPSQGGNDVPFKFEEREELEVKGKGKQKMYFVSRP